VDLLRRRYYSPVPNLDELPEGFWGRESPMHGVDFDTASQLAFVEEELAPYLSEFDPPLEPTGVADEYFMRNEFYGGVDAQLLYAVLRRFGPARVLELGSGYSSLVVEAAAERNRQEQRELRHTVVDPYPSGIFSERFTKSREIMARRAQDVPLSVYEGLTAGDVLLVDTTHTVKLGGDVTFLVLEVLPLLRRGVLVHIHDVFLPWEYPREWFEEEEWFWAEQYMIQAFLALNSEYEVLFGTQALARKHPTALAELISSFKHARANGEYAALWLRRTGGRDERDAGEGDRSKGTPDPEPS
jgi:methyltransferase family protein